MFNVDQHNCTIIYSVFCRLFQTPQRLQSQSELTPVELPPEVSLQAPLEETSLTKTAVAAVEPPSEGADHDQSVEALMPMEESRLGTSVAGAPTSAVVSTFTNSQSVVAAVVSYSAHHWRFLILCSFWFVTISDRHHL